jgi:transcriptional regulator with XRE-family HTH domain
MDKDLYLLVTGAQLRRRREAIGLTLAEVSQRSGVTVAHLSRIENGLTDPRLSTFQRILEAMGADFADASTPTVRTVSVATAIERRDAGRERVGSTNLGTSDADARLDQRERRGGDVDDERAGLGRHG